jgi:molybdate transport system ATP-binding protein
MGGVSGEMKTIQSNPALEVSISKSFGEFSLDASFAVPTGITILFGASGSGKTTLLNCVAGLLRPERGRISISGQPIFDADSNIDCPVTRRQIGYVFQDLALFPHLTVEDNIGYGLSDSRSPQVAKSISAFRLEHVRGRKPRSLSGGEQQRVALARALVTEPSALLLDEPLSALDTAIKKRIMDDLRVYLERQDIPVLYVTHSRDEVFALGQNVIALENGRVVGQGTPREVLTGHRHHAIAEWGGVENVLEGLIAAVHDQLGTMTVRVGQVELEVPLGHAKTGDQVSVGVSASDILLATVKPEGISARNVIAGRIVSLKQQDATVQVIVDCSGTQFQAHLTPGAVESLSLHPGSAVWVIMKTHSCFLITR